MFSLAVELKLRDLAKKTRKQMSPLFPKTAYCFAHLENLYTCTFCSVVLVLTKKWLYCDGINLKRLLGQRRALVRYLSQLFKTRIRIAFATNIVHARHMVFLMQRIPVHCIIKALVTPTIHSLASYTNYTRL